MAKFAKKIGIGHQTLYRMMDLQTNPSFKVITAILKAYPQVNPRWLLLEEGEMFDGGAAELRKEVEGLRSAIADKDRIIRLQEQRLNDLEAV